MTGMQERVKAILFFVLVGSIAGYFVYGEATRVGKPGVINIGQMAPEFAIKDQNCHPVKLSDYRGKVVFLNFWATWCAPCVEEAPDMEKLNKSLKDRKFQMLTLAIDTDWKPVNEFYAKHNLSVPVFLDPGQQVARGLYKITGVPETFLIDANGHVVRHTFGEHWADPRIVSYIESLIQQQDAVGAVGEAQARERTALMK
jgi:peroxiredoxin